MKSQSVAVEPLFDTRSTSHHVDPLKAYDSIVDVVFAFDENGTIQFVSPSCFHLLGYTQEEMQGTLFTQFIHPGDIEKTVQIVAERTHDCRTSNFENRYVRKDGVSIPLIWSGRWDATDKLLYCVARDGSEKCAVEQRLRKAQQIARVANFEFDVAGNCYTYTSDTLFDIFGLDKTRFPQFTPELFWSLVHPDDRAFVRESALQSEHLYNSTLEYRIVRPDGVVVYINRVREVLRDASGRPVKTIGTIQDITDRKIGELALRQSEERFRSLVQNGNDLLGIIDAAGNYLFVGENVKQHLGVSAADLLGKNAFAFIHPDDAAWLGARLQEIAPRQTVTVGPYRFRINGGEWRWMETTLTSHLDNPAIGGLVVNSRDVTERKHKDDELRKLSLIAQESQHPILLTNLQSEITWANRAFYQISEYSEEEVIGKRPEAVFLPGEEEKQAIAQVQQAVNNGKTVRSENRYVSKSGKEYWLDLTIQPVFDGSGEPVCFVGIGKDITQKKEVEKARRLSEQRFHALVQNGTDIIVILDKKAAFTYVSENAEALMGYAPTELVGLSALPFIHPDDKEKVSAQFADVLQNSSSAKGVEHRFLHKNGSWLWLESRGANHQDNDLIGGVLVNVRNITDRVVLQKRLNRELRGKQKEITAAVIKAQETERSQLALELHDNVNQILTTVKLYNEMYLSGYLQGKELLVKSTQYTQDCINEIRSISKRLSAPLLGKIALHDSIQELVASINLTRRLQIQYAPKNMDGCWVSEDLHLAVYRIVQEGLNNILKYADASQARVELVRHEEELYVSITDNGKGFDTEAKRSGIGITNMKTRAEHMNATFVLRSAPGQGCQIKICFPLVGGGKSLIVLQGKKDHSS
jgi:PAS domain S-box-containing protein